MVAQCLLLILEYQGNAIPSTTDTPVAQGATAKVRTILPAWRS